MVHPVLPSGPGLPLPLHHAAFLVLLVGTQAAFTVLALLNLGHGARRVEEEAGWLVGRVGIEEPDRVVAYQRSRTWLGIAASWTGLAAVLALLYGGGVGALAAAAGRIGLGPVTTGAVFFVLVGLVLAAVQLPFRWAGTFRVEERFGFNRQTARGWLRDVALGLALLVVATTVTVGALVWLIGALPTWWWLAAAAIYIPLQVVLQVVVPSVVAPLYWDFRPLPEGRLRDAVEEVLERARLPLEGIYVIDASRRTAHANAFFVGFGRHRRVVFFDTFLEDADPAEVQAVLAHELAHWQRGHIWRGIAAGAVASLVGLGLLAWLMAQPWLIAMFGLPATAHVGLLVGTLWLQPVGRWLSPLALRLSRRHERQADDDAVAMTGGAGPLADALTRIAATNLSNPFPHRLWAAFHATHPPLPERLARLGEERGMEADAQADASSP